MPRPCSVCSHPKRSEIDRAIAGGASIRGTSLRYAVSQDAIARHRDNHLGKVIAKANRSVQKRVEAAVTTKIEQEELEPLDTMTELRNIFTRSKRMLDACEAWLADPDYPTRYELGPRSNEITVVHEYQDGKQDNGAPIYKRRKATLRELLTEVEEDTGFKALNGRVVMVEYRHADPRNLVIATAEQLRKNVELLAKLVGQIADPATVELRIVNMVVNRPEAIR